MGELDQKFLVAIAVRDAAGKIVAHIFGRDEPWICPEVPAPLTMDEAKEMALNIAKAGAVLSTSKRVEANSTRRQVAA